MTAADQATAAATVRRLTPTMVEVLPAAAAGDLLYNYGTPRVRDRYPAVTRTARSLYRRGLIRLDRGDKLWRVTELGAAVLAQLDEVGA